MISTRIDRLVAAHTEFVRVAKKRGFNVDVLVTQELHPRPAAVQARANAF